MIVHLLVHALGKSISQKVNGCVVKRVTCEYCQEQYIYQLRRTASAGEYALFHVGVAEKTRKAFDKASAKLRRKLEHGVDPVGCPSCGWLQKDMAREKKKRAFKFIGAATLFAAFIQLLLWIVSNTLEISESALLWAMAVTLGAAALAVAYVLVSDVNRAAHRRTREALGPRCRAMPSAEFDALLAETPA